MLLDYKSDTLLAQAKDIFVGTKISITTLGNRHLVSAIGQRAYKHSFAKTKVDNLTNELSQLSRAAECYPQLAYVVYTRVYTIFHANRDRLGVCKI